MIEGNYRIAVAVIVGMAVGFALIKSDLTWRKNIREALALQNGRILKTVLLILGAGMLLYYGFHAAGWVPSAPQVRPAFLWSSLLGGALCGVGIQICGITPTTAVAALAAGRMQTVWVIIGMVLAYPAVKLVSEFLSETLYRWDVTLSRPEVADVFFSAGNPALYLLATVAVLLLLVHFTVGDSGGDK